MAEHAPMWSDDVTWAEHVQGQKRCMVLDLWLATGRDSQAFEAFVGEHGWPLVWSLLLHEQRPIVPPCMEPTGPKDFCVFDDGHSGPHYGADDVAAPVDLPPRPILLTPPVWTLEQTDDEGDEGGPPMAAEPSDERWWWAWQERASAFRLWAWQRIHRCTCIYGHVLSDFDHDPVAHRLGFHPAECDPSDHYGLRPCPRHWTGH